MGLDIFFTRKKENIVGYFRKVNFLVKYFSELGFDVEHQTPFEIEKSEVLDLLDRCKEVLNNNDRADELLPTMSGFFFGSIEYDKNYFEDVKEVKDYIESTLLPMFDDLESNESLYFETWY